MRGKGVWCVSNQYCSTSPPSSDPWHTHHSPFWWFRWKEEAQGPYQTSGGIFQATLLSPPYPRVIVPPRRVFTVPYSYTWSHWGTKHVVPLRCAKAGMKITAMHFDNQSWKLRSALSSIISPTYFTPSLTPRETLLLLLRKLPSRRLLCGDRGLARSFLTKGEFRVLLKK